jgi:hypothetical protein
MFSFADKLLLNDFAEWLSNQEELDVMTTDEAVDKYILECVKNSVKE